MNFSAGLEIENSYFTEIKIPQTTLYSLNDEVFLQALEYYEEGKYELIPKILKDDNNLDYSLLLCASFIQTNSQENAMNAAMNSVKIANKYHCYFHYFGFHVCMKLWQQTKNEEFYKRALFLYPQGIGAPNETLESLPEYKNLCIFKQSKTLSDLENGNLQESFKASEEQHFQYHICAANAYFMRGIIFKDSGKPEIAKVDFERAIGMEAKNPNNSQIYEMLRLL